MNLPPEIDRARRQIENHAREYGLDFYDVVFEVLDYDHLNEVAAFYFTQLPDSYAARTDRPDNVGVIGVAVFREYQPPRPAVLARHPLVEAVGRDKAAAAAERLGERRSLPLAAE